MEVDATITILRKNKDVEELVSKKKNNTIDRCKESRFTAHKPLVIKAFTRTVTSKDIFTLNCH